MRVAGVLHHRRSSMQRWYEAGMDGQSVGRIYLWKLLSEEPGKIDNFSFAFSTDLQNCHGSVFRFHFLADRLPYIPFGSQPSGGSNEFSFGFAIREPGLSTIRTIVACGPFSPSSSLHFTPVPISKRLNSAAGKLFL